MEHLNEQQFKERVISPETGDFLGDKPVIVDFYADWCAPCRMVAPILEKLETEYEGKIDFYKVDVDKEPGLAAGFSVRSIPSVFFIPKKGKASMYQGALPESQFKEIIKDTLKL